MGQGETLQTLSTHCARSQLSLQKLNKLADPNASTAGQVYQIYNTSAPAPALAPGGGGSSTGGELRGGSLWMASSGCGPARVDHAPRPVGLASLGPVRVCTRGRFQAHSLCSLLAAAHLWGDRLE